MKSFKKFMSEGPLASIMKQHDNPISFTLAAIKAQRANKIKIKQRGAASTRELAAAFQRYKKRKRGKIKTQGANNT